MALQGHKFLDKRFDGHTSGDPFLPGLGINGVSAQRLFFAEATVAPPRVLLLYHASFDFFSTSAFPVRFLIVRMRFFHNFSFVFFIHSGMATDFHMGLLPMFTPVLSEKGVQ